MPESVKGQCHCGAVKFEAVLEGGLAAAHRCSCSFCEMRGAVALTATIGNFRITQGDEELSLYTFNTHVAQHYFCSICGIYTHHQRRSNPGEFGINAACLDGVSPFDFAEVVVMNGRVHPNDDPDAPEVDGILSYRSNRPA